MSKLPEDVRQAILDKDKNHIFGRDGFCLQCKTMHRTDWRQNNLCPKLFTAKKEMKINIDNLPHRGKTCIATRYREN